MNRKIKLTHVISGLQVGGAEVMLCRILERIDRSRFECSVVCLGPRGPLADRIERAGVALICLQMRGPISLLSGLWNLIRIFRRMRPDAVHTWMYHGDFMGGLAAKFGGNPPVTWSIHHTTHAKGGIKWTTRTLTWLLARLSRWIPQRIICCSNASARAHTAQGYDAKKMEVIFNGADITACQPNAKAAERLRAELGIPAEAPVIGAAGRYHPQKDYPNFFTAALLLQQIRPDTHFVVCGHGLTRDNPDLRTFVQRSPHPERFHLLGLRSDMPELYPAFTLFTLAAAFGEGWPLTIGEAMACGVPCVATDLGDCRDLIAECGRIVPVKDSFALAKAWDEVLALRVDACAAMRNRARSRIIDHFSLAKVIQQYEQAYTALAHRHPLTPAQAWQPAVP